MIRHAVSRTDHPVWDEFLNYYDPFVTAVLRKMNFREPEIDDVRQLAFIRLWENLPAYRKQPGKAKFRSWLARLIRNVALNWIRDHQKENSESQLSEDTQSGYLVDSPDVEANIEKEWQAYVVKLAMTRLESVFTGKAFEVLQLSLEGHEAEAISEKLNLQKDSVYVLKNRVKTRMQHEIAQIRSELEEFSP
ncbi:DNA-directed RNA polymerase sigma-70 factor [Oceaniferula spumae]|uniref:DNA-directed RNA polymerase sigma-70 factor n=1 Tax=Oceaniferula spumae TaxID=2979115 RepID=A0AAT9FL22_9BACT